MKVKSIFRYPGGKAKAIKYIKPFIDEISHDEYREPFVGGGSVYLAKENVDINWINDKDQDLIAFYRIIKNKKNRERLIEELLKIKVSKKQHDEFYYQSPKKIFDKAIRYYFLNRCSFSGITRWNSYIGDVRWNIENAQHLLRSLGEKLKNTQITSLDFEEVITRKSSSKEVFMFIDPPYAESRQVAAYNVTFDDSDHLRLAAVLKSTEYKFLLTYDDCEFIRGLYDWCYQFDRTWTYSVANSRVHHNPRESGNELFLTNYKPVFITK